MKNTKDMNQILKHLDKTLGGGLKKTAGYDPERVADAIKQFPETFELRAFPGKMFRISPEASYINDYDGVTLYTQVLRDGEWLDAVKGSPEELRRDMVSSHKDEELDLSFLEDEDHAQDHLALQVIHGLSKIASELEATNPEAAKLVDTALEVLVNRLDK
jgi:hypothetical protein